MGPSVGDLCSRALILRPRQAQARRRHILELQDLHTVLVHHCAQLGSAVLRSSPSHRPLLVALLEPGLLHRQALHLTLERRLAGSPAAHSAGYAPAARGHCSAAAVPPSAAARPCAAMHHLQPHHRSPLKAKQLYEFEESTLPNSKEQEPPRT